jgi:hypothetical protein
LNKLDVAERAVSLYLIPDLVEIPGDKKCFQQEQTISEVDPGERVASGGQVKQH